MTILNFTDSFKVYIFPPTKTIVYIRYTDRMSDSRQDQNAPTGATSPLQLSPISSAQKFSNVTMVFNRAGVPPEIQDIITRRYRAVQDRPPTSKWEILDY